ncbi:MAG: M23 family metallopeptidase [Asgard group archaeon]|nr:M23 family metallopeptidase [Asgard group archaeon]
MKRKGKILLGIFIPIIVLGASFGGFILYRKWPATWSRDAPILDFPVENSAVIHIIGGYGYVPWGGFHNGIDFGCNTSVNILASCDVRVIGIRTWLYAYDPDRWQTSVQFTINWAYYLEIAFESWAYNETYANIQREAIDLEIGQIVTRGNILGQLLYHGEGTHIHFMIKYNGNDACPYNYFSNEAKILFDSLFAICGVGGTPCNETVT